MELRLQWHKPIPLRDGSKQQPRLTYIADLDDVPDDPGVYVFGRFHGDAFEALYVGKAEDLAARIRGQLKTNVSLMNHMKHAKSGTRVVVPASFHAKRGQRTKSCIALIERALIRYYLSLGNDLVNLQGVNIKGHEIVSSGIPKQIIEREVFLQR